MATMIVRWINEGINKLKTWKLAFKVTNFLYEKYGQAKDFSKCFKKLFFENEIGELYGYKNGNFYKIILLYIILFISVGFGIQSKKFFNQQLDNPFVKYLLVPIEGDASLCAEQLLDSIENRYLSSEFKNKYHIDAIRAMSTGNRMRVSSDFVTNGYSGLGDTYNSTLIGEAVFGGENKFVGNTYNHVNNRSVVVTLNLLKELYLVEDNMTIEDLTTDDIQGYIMMEPYVDGLSVSIPLLIQGVVEQLPWGYDYLLPSKYNDHLFGNPNVIYFNESDNQIGYFVDTIVDYDFTLKVVENLLNEYNLNTDSNYLHIELSNSIHEATWIWFNNYDNNLPGGFNEIFKDRLSQKLNINETKIINANDKNYPEMGEGWAARATINAVLIDFEDLRKVRDFNVDFKNFTSEVVTEAVGYGSTKKIKGLELELNEIEMRSTLNIIEIIVTAFLIIIAVLAMTALVSFVRVLFEKYFQKIDKNIGTFMAFGINIKVVYAIMLTIFAFSTVLLSFVLALVIGLILEYLLLLLIGNSIGDEVSLFSMRNIWIVGAIVAIGFANGWAFKKASKIFSEWPGDIINDRLK